MARKGKKIVRETNNFCKFDRVGDIVSGTITREFVSTTKYGEQDCIEIMQEDGLLICVGISSNLSFYKEDGIFVTGAVVSIEYTGKDKNPNTGNTYKTFDVYDLLAEDDESETPPNDADIPV